MKVLHIYEWAKSSVQLESLTLYKYLPKTEFTLATISERSSVRLLMLMQSVIVSVELVSVQRFGTFLEYTLFFILDFNCQPQDLVFILLTKTIRVRDGFLWFPPWMSPQSPSYLDTSPSQESQKMHKQSVL